MLLRWGKPWKGPRILTRHRPACGIGWPVRPGTRNTNTNMTTQEKNKQAAQDLRIAMEHVMNRLRQSRRDGTVETEAIGLEPYIFNALNVFDDQWTDDPEPQAQPNLLLEAIAKELGVKSDWWRNNQHDPHGIGNAVMTALFEVRKSILDAVAKGRL